MKTNFITAEEANKIAAGYSAIERICREIKNVAKNGDFQANFLKISLKDKAKLEVLGYTVTENHNEIFPYTVSWE